MLPFQHNAELNGRSKRVGATRVRWKVRHAVSREAGGRLLNVMVHDLDLDDRRAADACRLEIVVDDSLCLEVANWLWTLISCQCSPLMHGSTQRSREHGRVVLH